MEEEKKEINNSVPRVGGGDPAINAYIEENKLVFPA